MKIAMQSLAVLVYIWLAVSPVIWIFWSVFGFPEADEYSSRPPKFWFVAIFLGAIGAFGFIISAGLDQCLIFLPESWGSIDEDGQFVSVRSAISKTLGAMASLGIIYLIDEKTKHKRK